MTPKILFNKPGDGHYLIYKAARPTAIRAFVEEYGKGALKEYSVFTRYGKIRDIMAGLPSGSTYTKKNYKKKLVPWAYRNNKPIWYIYSPEGYLSKPFSRIYTWDIKKMLLFSTRDEARQVKIDGERVKRIVLHPPYGCRQKNRKYNENI